MRRVVTATVAGVALTAMIGIGVASAATGDGPAGRIADVLAGLVSSGTIDQSQADAVAKALEDSRAQAQSQREADRAERQAEVDELLQRTLDMTADEVRAALQSGKTLKEVAGDNAKALADGAVGLVKEHSAEAVADGRITQEQADQMVTHAQAEADAWLAGEATDLGRGLMLLGGMGRGMGHGGMGPGMGGMGHHGRGGPGWDVDGDEGSSSPSGSSTTSNTVLPA